MAETGLIFHGDWLSWRERAGKAIDLIDHHDGDLAGADVGQEVLQGRAVSGWASL